MITTLIFVTLCLVLRLDTLPHIVKNKSPFKAWVKHNIARLNATKYNTNNAWGFGGSYGIEYLLPDGRTLVRIGLACTRHAGTYPCEYAGRYYGFSTDPETRLTFDEFLALDNPSVSGILTL